MKIVFLDIDGVLNWNGSKSRCGMFLGIDTIRVRRLAKIIKTTDAKIVLTSTWKDTFIVGAYRQEEKTAKYLSNKLRAQGLTVYDKISDKYKWLDRAGAIEGWLTKHPGIDGYVVLDDEFFVGYEKPIIGDHLIHTIDDDTDQTSGLTDYLTEQAINILNNQAKGCIMDKNYKEKFKDFFTK